MYCSMFKLPQEVALGHPKSVSEHNSRHLRRREMYTIIKTKEQENEARITHNLYCFKSHFYLKKDSGGNIWVHLNCHGCNELGGFCRRLRHFISEEFNK